MSESRFNAWLKSNDLEYLVPEDNKPRPLMSRVSILLNQSRFKDVKTLVKAWEDWKYDELSSTQEQS